MDKSLYALLGSLGLPMGRKIRLRKWDIPNLFLSPISILEFDGQAAEEYGRIKAELEKRNTDCL